VSANCLRQVDQSSTVSLFELCQIDCPMLKVVPKPAASMFARTWAGLLQEATSSKLEARWADFFMFPKVVLLAPLRGGRRVSKKSSFADLVLGRIQRWTSDRDDLWQEVKKRSGRRPTPKAVAAPTKSFEKAAVAALRLGDVKKALQILNAAPFAPKEESTLISLRKLHPEGKPPSPETPLFRAPVFSEELVKTALASFGAGSAAGLFGYRPFLLHNV